MIAEAKIDVPFKTRSTIFIVFIFLGITFAEWVFAYQNVTYGIILSLVLALIIYLALPVIKLGQNFTDCSESLVLIPLYILITASLPWFFLPQELVLPAVYSAILALCAWHIFRKNISFRDIGFKAKKPLKYILIGFLIGAPLGALEYFLITPAKASPTFEMMYLFRDFVYMILFVGLGEELLFRGLVQRDMSKVFGWRWGLVCTSLLFGVMHLTWRSVPELGFTTCAGVIFGYLYQKTDSLTAPIIAHGIGNTVLVSIMPYLLPR
jgi:uncharacterized protein